MFQFTQSTGVFINIYAKGYSGSGLGKNNPALQEHKSLGPLPVGKYFMEVIKDSEGKWTDYEGKKVPVIRLTPFPQNQMFGRAGFLIHGDSINAPGTASLGCVIENHDDRVRIATAVDAGENVLEVVSK